MQSSSPVFADGLGRRVVRASSAGAAFTEHLLLDPVLANLPGFHAALADRVAQLHGRRLTSYARVHRLDIDGPGGVSVVSEYVPAWRLADVLDVAESENLTLDIGVVMLLLRQLLPTAALLSSQGRDAASGALGPEHLLLTPQARMVLTDYVFGPAIDALQWSPEQLWQTLRVAVPRGAGGRAVSQRGDVVQVGVTVLSLVVGRRLRDDEFPERLATLVQSARQKTPAIIDAPLSPGLRDWLLRALQLGVKNFATLFESQMALERLLTTDGALLAQPTELDQAVSRFARFMPPFELPEPEVELLLEAPPPDSVPLAVAFDKTPETTAVPDAPRASRKSGVRKTVAAAESAPFEVEVEPQTRTAPVPAPVGPAFAPASVATTRVAAGPPPAPPAVVVSQPRPTPVADVAPRFSALDDLPHVVPSTSVPWWRSTRAVAALFAVAIVQTAVVGWLLSQPTESLGSDGELVVSSRPEGATVVIDDREHGVTPLTVRLGAGTHVLQVRAGTGEPRVIPLSIRSGVQTAQYVELVGVATTGVLEVRSEPAKARVTIDGRERGSTPLTLRDVAPGDYQVVVERGGWKSTQVVRVEPGGTAQLLVPIR